LLLLRLFEDFSEAELPLGELSLEDECDDECSLVTGAAARRLNDGNPSSFTPTKLSVSVER